jgi:hypothetical protein
LDVVVFTDEIRRYGLADEAFVSTIVGSSTYGSRNPPDALPRFSAARFAMLSGLRMYSSNAS